MTKLHSRIACSALMLIVAWWSLGAGEEIRPFNGKNLEGWTFEVDKHARENRDTKLEDVFQVKNRVIICRGNPYGVLRHEGTFENYALSLNWAWPPSIAGASAVFVHAGEEEDAAGNPKSLEVSLFRDNAGDIFYRTFQARELFENDWVFKRKTKKSPENEMGQWNKLEVICHENMVTVYVNGQAVNQINDYPAEPRGSICLQSRGTTIYFSNLRIIHPLTKAHLDRERAASQLFGLQLAAHQAKKDAKADAIRVQVAAQQRLAEEDDRDPAADIQPEFGFSNAATAIPFPPDARDLDFDGSLDEISFKSGSSPRALARFYRVEMTKRSWQEDREAATHDDGSVAMKFLGGGVSVEIDVDKYSDATEVSIESEDLNYDGTEDPKALVRLGIPQPRGALYLQQEILLPSGSLDLEYEPQACSFTSRLKPAAAVEHFRTMIRDNGFQESSPPTVKDDHRFAEWAKTPIELSFYVFPHPAGSRLLFLYKNEDKEELLAPLPDTPAESLAKRAADSTTNEAEETPEPVAVEPNEKPIDSSPRKIDVAANQGSATVTHGSQRRALNHVAAFQTKSRPDVTEVVFSSRAIPFDRMQRIIASTADFSFGDLFEFDFPDFLVLQVGDYLGFSYTAGPTGISRGINDGRNTTAIVDGRIKGELTMSPEEIFDEPFAFLTTMNAAIITPNTVLSRSVESAQTSRGPAFDLSAPLPPGAENVSGGGGAYRKVYRATSRMSMDELVTFYRRARELPGWREVGGHTEGRLDFRSATDSMLVELDRSGSETAIQVTTRDIAGAKQDGILPEPGKGRLIMANAHTVDVTVSIGKTDYPLKAGQGHKDPKRALSYAVAPGTYTVVINVPGSAEKTEKLQIKAGTSWAIIALPTGGYMSIQMF